MEALVITAVLFLAFANGANDNIKGVATLYGSGELSYRKALSLATFWTAVGALCSMLLASGLVKAFSAKGLLPAEFLTTEYLAAVAVGAAATVMIATRIGAPISTTHSLVGGLVGAGLVAAGSDLKLGALGAAFLLPLLAGPFMAVGLTQLGTRAKRRAGNYFGIRATSCICVDPQWVPVVGGSGTASLHSTLVVNSGEQAECEAHSLGSIAGVSAQEAVHRGHLFSGSLVSFARGLNDAPKLLGILVGASVLSPRLGILAITAVMALGGLLCSRKVAKTLAKKITPMTPAEGLTANLATAFLVVAASRFGLPVSTTHVSTGGVFGIGGSSGALRWDTVWGILSAWVATLPLAAALSATTMWVMLQ